MTYTSIHRRFVSALLSVVLCLTLWVPFVFSQNTGITQAKTITQTISIETLEKELLQLEKQLARYTDLKTPLNEREAYTKKVIDLLEKIAALKNEEANKDQEQQEEHAGKRLILSEILINDKPSNIAGSQEHLCSPKSCDNKSLQRFNALEIQEYPSIIQVGQPFSFRLKGTARLKKPEGIYGVSLYSAAHGAARNQSRAFLKIGGVITEARGLKNMVDVPTKKDSVDESDVVNLFVNFQPQPFQKEEVAIYKLATLKTDGKEDLHRGGSHLGREFGLELPSEGRNRELLVFFEGGGALIKFKYKWGDENNQPLVAEQLDVMDNTTLASDTENTDNTSGQNDASGLDSQMTDNSNSQSTTQTNGQNNRADPSQEISAKNPHIQQLITAWINTAEPPKNATIGAELRYGKWAQVHGKTPTGMITLNDKPDAAKGYANHFKYLWTVKAEKDSVDHCTLGQYIDIKLAGQSTAQCKGRHKPLVPNMVGMKAQAAQKLLKGRKLSPTFKVGAPAPDASKSLTVIKQSATQGSFLKKQNSVVLSVYSPYVNRKILGSFVGQSAKNAQAKLKQQGFKVKLTLGSKATNTQQSTKVETQSPKYGTQLKVGSLVTLAVHPAYVQLVKVPDLQRMSIEKATTALHQVGLRHALDQGPRPRGPQESERVMGQSIPAGKSVKKDTLVRFKVFAKYVPPPQVVPNVIGLTKQQALSAMTKVLISPMFIDNAPTRSPTQVGRIQRQSLRPGSIVKKHAVMTVYVYADAEKLRRKREAIASLRQPPDYAKLRKRPSGITVNQSRQKMSEARTSTTPTQKSAPKPTDCGESGFRGSKCGGLGFMQFGTRSTKHERNRRILEAWTPSAGGTGDWYVFEVLKAGRRSELRLKRGKQKTAKWYRKTGPFKNCEKARKNALLYYNTGKYSFPNSANACGASRSSTPATRRRVTPIKPSTDILGVPREYWKDEYY